MTTDDLLVDPGASLDMILIRLIDDDPELSPWVEIQHAGRYECIMLEVEKVPELIRALRSLVPADDDAEEEAAAADQE